MDSVTQYNKGVRNVHTIFAQMTCGFREPNNAVMTNIVDVFSLAPPKQYERVNLFHYDGLCSDQEERTALGH